MVAREHNILAAAKNSSALTAEVTTPVLDALTLLTRRGQGDGLIRADLTPDDMHRIMAMLTSVLWSVNPHGDGWRRYVVLVLDALSPVGASTLPPANPILHGSQTDNCWSL